MDWINQANSNFDSQIRKNSYPGRGLVLGKMENNTDYVIVYFIMGRSPNSQNRIFETDGDRVWTKAWDESLVTDPSLIIYDAICSLPQIHIVSNGDQTITIRDAIKEGKTFCKALQTRQREPDAPNFTPRISGLIDFSSPSPIIKLSILKANKFNSDLTDRYLFKPALIAPGSGYALTTYMGDGNPLPSFNGEPLLLPLKGNLNNILEDYWQSLDSENKVSLVVKQISSTGETIKIILKNRHN